MAPPRSGSGACAHFRLRHRSVVAICRRCDGPVHSLMIDDSTWS